MAKYLDPKADVTFKKVFGEHKNLVTSLLNPQTGEALEIIRESGLNDVERAAYEGFWDRISIETTKKAYADRAFAERDAAIAKLDAEKARADAATEKLRQAVCKMKDKGFAVADIADLTGLTADEINAL